jgi:mRNA interferase RelE/StbE
MTRYTVIVSPSAEKELARVRDKVLNRRLKLAILALGDDPRREGCLKMKGHADQWRVRVGDWRIVYRIEDGRLVVVVVRVAPRSGVYG